MQRRAWGTQCGPPFTLHLTGRPTAAQAGPGRPIPEQPYPIPWWRAARALSVSVRRCEPAGRPQGERDECDSAVT